MRASLAGRLCLSVALAAALGCGSDSQLGGPPQLVKFLVQVPGEMEQDLLMPPDGGVPAVSGAASFRLVFNRLLAGDKIETVMNGVITPKTDVVSVTWVNAPPGAPPIVASTLYDPSGALGVNIPGPKVTVSVSPGLPSGAQVTIKLDRAKLTSKANEPFGGPDTQTITTLPFGVELNAKPNEMVPPAFAAQLTFTNVPAATVGDRIKVTAGGMPVMVTSEPDMMDPRKVSLTPAGGWKIGQTYTVTVDKEAADRLGVKLGADFVTSFSVADPSDGGSVPDAGADGGAGDGSSDAAVDAASGDASPGDDAPADVAAGG